MRIPVRHRVLASASAAAAAVLLLAGGAAVAAPQHASARPSHPVDRYTAWQACRSAVWEWAFDEEKVGTTVDTRLNGYSPRLEARQDGGWYVQIAGTFREPVTANDIASFCLVKGSEQSPRIADYAFPR